MRVALLAFVALAIAASASKAHASPLRDGAPKALSPQMADGGAALGLIELLSLDEEERVGAWVEMAVTVGGKVVGPYVRYLIAEVCEEGTWVELWISQRPGSGTQSFRILLSRGPGGRSQVKKVLHRAFGGGLEELSIPDGSGSHPDSPAALFEEVIASHDDREKGAGLSSARGAPGAGLQGATGEWGPLLTNAGTFQTRKVEIRRNGRTHTTLWLAEEIPVLGLARIEMQGIVGMEVHSFGTDGKSLIDREPPHPGQTPPGAN